MNKELSSLFLQILGLIIVGIFAWRIKKERQAYSFAVCFMFIINFVAQIIIAGEGPGACAGAVILPLYGVIITWICVSLSSKRGNKQDDNRISTRTTRYSTLIKRIFEEYNENVEIYIEGSRYTEKDIPKLLEWWCNNKTIKASVDFTLSRDGVSIFGFHDTPDDFWAAMSERLFIERLAEEKIVRFKVYPHA